jgi:hypothetical protein
MNLKRNVTKEKRWLIVAEDGRHVTVGRDTDPSEREIEEAGLRLDGLGIAGWLVVSEGGYYTRGAVTLLMVRQVSRKRADWPAAERLWHDQRAIAVSGA